MRTTRVSTQAETRTGYKCSRCGLETTAFSNTQRLQKRLCRRCFGKRKDLRPKELNDLTGTEWAQLSLSVKEYPDVRSDKQRKHGACFPISLAVQFIRKYTKRGDTVLDPFAGVGTTHDACIKLQRHCIGLDINKAFCLMARRDFPAHSDYFYRIFTDDAACLDKYIKPGSIDFVLTSPPYASLLKNVNGTFAYKWKEHSKLPSISNPKPYSKKAGDIGNMTTADFFRQLGAIMVKLHLALKDEKYMAWVVKDYRDIKHGISYVNFHGQVISCATESGFTLWDIVIYDQTKFRPLVCLGYPSKRYYHNIGHSYVLIFRKGSL